MDNYKQISNEVSHYRRKSLEEELFKLWLFRLGDALERYEDDLLKKKGDDVNMKKVEKITEPNLNNNQSKATQGKHNRSKYANHVDENVESFANILNNMLQTYRAKQIDYGDSFNKSLDNFGIIAGMARITDKYNRLENILKNGGCQVKDETLEDTLLDLANYSVMVLNWLKKNKQ